MGAELSVSSAASCYIEGPGTWQEAPYCAGKQTGVKGPEVKAPSVFLKASVKAALGNRWGVSAWEGQTVPELSAD